MNDHERVAANESELAYLKDVFLAEIRRIDQVLGEREKQVGSALAASQKAIDKAEIDNERSRQQANEWRGTISDREKGFVPLVSHDRMQVQVDQVVARLDEGRGRQAAWVAAAGIIATILAIGVGQIIRQGITASDVSGQIQREAPWNRDKAATEKRIAVLERQQEALRVQITRLQQRDEFFCVTRATAGLPGC